MGPMDRYTRQEADRLSDIMADDPHRAANELRNQLQQLDPQTASVLVARTKFAETAKTDPSNPGLGDLQIQQEFDQYGRDTGWRNVTMASPDGIEQIAEIQARRPGYGEQGYGYQNNIYGPNTLGYASGIIVGDLLWQQRLGIDFNDDRYRGWCNREQGREQYWGQNNAQFQANWANPGYRSQYQAQPNWQHAAAQPTPIIVNNRVDSTYINNRVDTTTVNRPVDITHINQTIQYAHPQGAAHPTVGVIGRSPYPAGEQQGHMPIQGTAASRTGAWMGEPGHGQQPQARPGGERTYTPGAESRTPLGASSIPVEHRYTGTEGRAPLGASSIPAERRPDPILAREAQQGEVGRAATPAFHVGTAGVGGAPAGHVKKNPWEK